jgi:hypothetical protein
MQLSSDLFEYDVGLNLVLTDFKDTDDAGNAIAPTFSDWLYKRAALWCAGSSVQHEVYTRLFSSRARATS